jgi:tellurite resistance protein TerC
MEFLMMDWMGKPLWSWLTFIGIVFAIMAFDLGLFNRKAHLPSIKESSGLTTLYIIIAVAYGAWIWASMGEMKAMEFYTGYVMELSLSVDNIFVISLVFASLSIPGEYRHRVLFWGILGVLLLRAIFIGLGAALVSQFAWVLLLFGVFLLFTGIKMFFSNEEAKDISDNRILKWMRNHMLITPGLVGQRFFLRQPHPQNPARLALWVTPLFVALVIVNVVDVVFAVDSVPAVFAVTQDPFIVYTSNVFACIGLRSLYFTLEAMVHRFQYLSKALAIVLTFIGGKIMAAEIFHYKIPTEVSLAVVLSLIVGGVVVSLARTAKKPH